MRVNGLNNVVALEWSGCVLANNHPPSLATMSLDLVLNRVGNRISTIRDVWYVAVPSMELMSACTGLDGLNRAWVHDQRIWRIGRVMGARWLRGHTGWSVPPYFGCQTSNEAETKRECKQRDMQKRPGDVPSLRIVQGRQPTLMVTKKDVCSNTCNKQLIDGMCNGMFQYACLY